MLYEVITPAYNEEKAIGETLTLINSVIKNINNYKFEIIVSNNNSKDRTKEISESLSAFVVDELKQGYGNAYKKGLSYNFV